MKYLLVGFILLLVPWMAPSTAPRPSRDVHLDAWFQVTGADGLETDAEIFVDAQQDRAEVRLALDRTGPACPGDSSACPAGAISTNAVAEVRPGDVVVARDLTWATLHTMVSVYDAISRCKRDIRIDLNWSATGPAYHVASVERSVVYDGTARGVVASAANDYVAGGRSDRGSIGQY